MTHEELRTKVISFKNVPFDPLVDALLTVVELHKPKHFIDNDGVYCSCSLSPLITYPYPTIQAIEKELGNQK